MDNLLSSKQITYQAFNIDIDNGASQSLIQRKGACSYFQSPYLVLLMSLYPQACSTHSYYLQLIVLYPGFTVELSWHGMFSLLWTGSTFLIFHLVQSFEECSDCFSCLCMTQATSFLCPFNPLLLSTRKFSQHDQHDFSCSFIRNCKSCTY